MQHPGLFSLSAATGQYIDSAVFVLLRGLSKTITPMDNTKYSHPKQKSLLPSRLFHTQSLTNKISWQKFFSNLSSTLLTLISFHVTKIAVLSIFYNRRNRLKTTENHPHYKG